MSFVRPEVRAALWRWRETLVGGAVALLGLWWMAGPRGLLFWIGAVLLAAGAALALAGVQRARFRTGGGGPGVVQVVEGQLAYFGPETGGVIDVAAIRRVALEGGRWRIEAPGSRLEIPVDAEGAEALFDVFAALPGLGTETVLAALEGDAAQESTGGSRLLWQAGPRRLH